ncbi:HAD hydrolase-like protein [Ornithinicoccus halotolerans]|uniref:HAD hydrolase-like protein n=1 Tax=Ornithinicoccus halotolerans TaxID=1748220 RepID=UPI00129707D1|nr:HAD hydrolase-like protein [Ornithinicoccus halotolerans]
MRPASSRPSPSLPARPSAVLLDMDGTIIASGPVITASLAATLRAFGYPVPDHAGLERYVGPPLPDTLRHLTGVADPAELSRMIAHYRAVYAEHGDLGAVYPGMAELIREVHRSGLPLALATSKRTSVALTVLAQQDLTDQFDAVCGAGEDESGSDKATVVASALAELARGGHNLSAPVMVGDRFHDVEGAALHQVPTILCRWGYGTTDDEEGAALAVSAVAELRTALGLH